MKVIGQDPNKQIEQYKKDAWTLVQSSFYRGAAGLSAHPFDVIRTSLCNHMKEEGASVKDVCKNDFQKYYEQGTFKGIQRTMKGATATTVRGSGRELFIYGPIQILLSKNLKKESFEKYEGRIPFYNASLAMACSKAGILTCANLTFVHPVDTIRTRSSAYPNKNYINLIKEVVSNPKSAYQGGVSGSLYTSLVWAALYGSDEPITKYVEHVSQKDKKDFGTGEKLLKTATKAGLVTTIAVPTITYKTIMQLGEMEGVRENLSKSLRSGSTKSLEILLAVAFLQAMHTYTVALGRVAIVELIENNKHKKSSDAVEKKSPPSPRLEESKCEEYMKEGRGKSKE